ncbi:NigD1/NigD2 family lipoprotein [Capnocytophaga canimorsus]|uniref:NigD-like protein n=1 Tax=Capnocytophaga canimorsus TaxID=28188 RepID=UPI000F6E3B20|nr:NigD-like protein [Capnocytophaga canimorsus]VEJ20145.1 NigD-like protein [Capnocytophaga canimorsus]
MNTFRFSKYALGLLMAALTLQSCIKDDNMIDLRPTAVVTVRPQADGSFFLQLDDVTKLTPTNMKKSPFGNKEVRALVNYTKENSNTKSKSQDVRINWIDSIRTKKPVPDLGAENDAKYGNDAIEVVKDWLTVAEDGYLTLRIRTQWSHAKVKHNINLLTNTASRNAFDLELRHDAKGDVGGPMGEALIAFNLNELPRVGDSKKVKVKLKWKSYNGEKTTEFDLQLRP